MGRATNRDGVINRAEWLRDQIVSRKSQGPLARSGADLPARVNRKCCEDYQQRGKYHQRFLLHKLPTKSSSAQRRAQERGKAIVEVDPEERTLQEREQQSRQPVHEEVSFRPLNFRVSETQLYEEQVEQHARRQADLYVSTFAEEQDSHG